MSYGLDRELRNKRNNKFDPRLENEAISWIENVTGARISGGVGSLKSGVVLCQLVNRIRPNSVRRINHGRMPFTQMENVNGFLMAAKSLGVSESDLFMTVDLYEEKNLPQVVQCLHALGSASRKVRGFSGPYIGAKTSTSKNIQFSQQQLNKGKSEIPILTREVTKKSNQSGMFDNSRNIVKKSTGGKWTKPNTVTSNNSYGGGQRKYVSSNSSRTTTNNYPRNTTSRTTNYSSNSSNNSTRNNTTNNNYSRNTTNNSYGGGQRKYVSSNNSRTTTNNYPRTNTRTTNYSSNSSNNYPNRTTTTSSSNRGGWGSNSSTTTSSSTSNNNQPRRVVRSSQNTSTGQRRIVYSSQRK
ncbi:muscle-specific protein [Anaeramoeba flamelloides]|uniref:Muscle-specific protein n=1 Tax=Anaeramoeba flamelloides TaxID=1746091 RepID=A0AAV7Z2N9_9EUKA|nr:muscle-specific protein [Anaeramoeba flamelloides]